MNTSLLLKNNPPVESKTMRTQERDIESQNNITENVPKTDLLVPLKGILKNTDINVEDETRAGLMAVKYFITTILIIVSMPMIICDIYFGFHNNHCINTTSNEQYFTMKMYLLGSGFIGLAGIIILIYSLSIENNSTQTNIVKSIFVKSITLIGGIFQIIWNILGAETFWGTIYKEGNCDAKISTYIFISLIIKFVINLFTIIQKLNIQKK